MSDRDLAKTAAEMAVKRLAVLIEDAGPLGMAGLDAAALLIAQAIDEAYTTRFEAERIEFEDLDGADK